MVIVPSPSRLASTPSAASHAAVVRDLLHLAARGLVTLHAQRGDNILVAIPDWPGELDWFVVGACGHASNGHVYRTQAEQWQCPVCDEQRLSERNVSDLAARLRAVAWHAPDDTSIAAVNGTQSVRARGADRSGTVRDGPKPEAALSPEGGVMLALLLRNLTYRVRDWYRDRHRVCDWTIRHFLRS